MTLKQAYYLAIHGDLLMGTGETPEQVAEEMEQCAMSAGVVVKRPTIVGPVHLYQRDEDLPVGAKVVYRGPEMGKLQNEAYAAVLVV